MVDLLLRHAGQLRRFAIREEGTDGWEVLEETEGGIVRRVRYDDWHRVERARAMFDLTAQTLRQQGWTQI
jgi:hypothetical protein